MSAPVAEPVRPSIPATPPAPTPSRPAAYTRVAAAGLLVMAAAPALMLALGAIAGMDLAEGLTFLGPMIVVPLLVAGLVWRFGLWAKILAILTAIAATTMLFWVVFGLSYPGSLGDFVPAVAFPLGALLAVGGSIAAIVAKRRGHIATTATPMEKRLIGVVLAIVALAVAGSVITGFVQRDATAADADADLTATFADFEFAEGTYEAAAGETIRVHNTDPFTHTFTVPELGIDETVLPGAYALVEIPDDTAAGTYTVYCEPHSDMDEPDPEKAGMAGTLTIE